MTAGEEVTASTLITPGQNAQDITPKQDGGVLKEIIKEGEGNTFPAAGCTIYVYYEGKLTDGTVFDSNKSGRPFEFTLRKGAVIKGWEIGVATMKKGEVALLTCKPDYGYESQFQESIPPGSTLIFEITMIDWNGADLSKDNDGGIIKQKTYTLGRTYSSPSMGEVVEVHLTGKCGDKTFEDRDLKFNIGEGNEVGVIEGVETALQKFKKGEKSVLWIKPKYAFKDEGNAELGVPPDADVEYTVELKNFEQSPKSWNMSDEERVAQAKLLKERATNYFKANKYEMAINVYNQVSEYVSYGLDGPETDSTNDSELIQEKRSLYIASKLNLAISYLKLNQYYEAKKNCDLALQFDPNNVKGLFRRGQANLGMGESEEARADFESVLRIEPGNKLAANQIIVCQNISKQQRERDKKIYGNMFEKFARKDKEDGSARFGWWDDEKKEPVIPEIEPIDVESIEEAKAEKKKQLEHLKKIAKAKKERMEIEKETIGKQNEETKDAEVNSSK